MDIRMSVKNFILLQSTISQILLNFHVFSIDKKSIFVCCNLSKTYRAHTSWRIPRVIRAMLACSQCENLIVLNSHFSVCCEMRPRMYHFPRFRTLIRHRKNSGPVVKPRSQMHLSIPPLFKIPLSAVSI